MSNNNRNIPQLVGILGLAIACNGILGSLTNVSAQPSQTQDSKESAKIANQGLPTNRRDGGTRSACVANSQDFVALIPETGINRTTSIKPKLYFHVPENPQTIEFVLRDQNDRLVYETFLETSGQSGIMSVDIPLPVNQKSLSTSTEYHWYLSSICNPQKRSQDIVLEGWIEHQALSASVEEQLANLSTEEKIEFYQKQNIWHDLLATAAEELETNSHPVGETQWSELLENINLTQFADRPLIEP